LVDFLKLLQNENMKIYRRAATWVMFALVVGIPVMIALAVYLFTPGDRPSNWFITLIASNILINLVAIFTVVKAADSVAGEFSQGTIKLLLIRPWNRSTILLSKFLALILFGLIMTVTAFVASFVTGAAFFGYAGSPEDMGRDSPWTYMLLWYLYQFISIVVIATLAFMMSAVFRSSGLTIGLSIFLLFAGNIITSILMQLDKPFVKYVLFPHLQLATYLDGGPGPLPMYSLTLGFSLAVLGAYFLFFVAVAWLVFSRRDVS
jgi:ABC-2 type transport system permease protein